MGTLLPRSFHLNWSTITQADRTATSSVAETPRVDVGHPGRRIRGFVLQGQHVDDSGVDQQPFLQCGAVSNELGVHCLQILELAEPASECSRGVFGVRDARLKLFLQV